MAIACDSVDKLFLFSILNRFFNTNLLIQTIADQIDTEYIAQVVKLNSGETVNSHIEHSKRSLYRQSPPALAPPTITKH